MALTDEEFIERTVRYATNSDLMDLPRWVIVRDIFCVGSVSAKKLCSRFKIDPDEVLKSRKQCCAN